MPRFFSLLVYLCVLVISPAQVAAQDVTVIAYPRIYNFPGQQLCQVDRSDRRYREFCAPQSYHPFGATGYRPLGTYGFRRDVRPYVLAPNAKIVRIPARMQRSGSADEE